MKYSVISKTEILILFLHVAILDRQSASIIRVTLFKVWFKIVRLASVTGAIEMIRGWLRSIPGDVTKVFLHAITSSETSLINISYHTFFVHNGIYCTAGLACESLMECEGSSGKK